MIRFWKSRKQLLREIDYLNAELAESRRREVLAHKVSELMAERLGYQSQTEPQEEERFLCPVSSHSELEVDSRNEPTAQSHPRNVRPAGFEEIRTFVEDVPFVGDEPEDEDKTTLIMVGLRSTVQWTYDTLFPEEKEIQPLKDLR